MPSKNTFAEEVSRSIKELDIVIPDVDVTGMQRFSSTDQQWIRNELGKLLKQQQRGYEAQIRERDEKIAELSTDLKRAARAAEK